MAILLASRVAEIISGTDILTLVERAVFQPLGMKHSAQGLGRFALADMVAMQTDRAAPESGGGDSAPRNGTGTARIGAGSVRRGAARMPRLRHCRLPEGVSIRRGRRGQTGNSEDDGHESKSSRTCARGLGFNVGAAAGSAGCSDKTFGHTGSTGTIAWADPQTRPFASC